MKNQHETPEALAHELFTAAQLAPGEGIEDAVGRLAALVEAQQNARIAELEARIKTMAEEHADELMVAHKADSQPAPAREEEREAFKAAHRHLELDEVPDAWGRPMFKYSHVEASWLGWIASAARAPADSVTAPAGGEIDRLRAALVYAAFALHGKPQYMLAEGIALIDGDTVRVSRDGWTVEASVNPARATPAARAADSVLEDAAQRTNHAD